MGNKGRDRDSRRRFEDHDSFGGLDKSYEPPRQSFRRTSREDAAPSGPPVDATVKWFNEEKGFGFVELADGSGDAFLHIGVLQNSGHEVAAPATKLRVQVGQGQKGRQVTAVLEVDASGAGSSQQTRQRTPSRMLSDRGRVDPGAACTMEGIVKWFNPDKGFGFVVADDGERDVFIHISVVERAGMRVLTDGQRVSMQVAKTQKGREAISVALLG